MVVGVKKSKQNFASAEILVLVFKSSDSYTVYHYFNYNYILLFSPFYNCN